MISTQGIYSLYPNLSDIAYSYTFTSFPINSMDEAQSFISNGDISQFSGKDDENEKDYILILINRVLFVLSERGEVLFL